MSKIDKRYTLFAFQVLGPFISAWALWQYTTLPLLLLTAVMFFLFRCVGAVITFHRILGHRTHKMHPWVEFVCTALGFYGSLSSPIEFCASHVHHHKYTDTWDDPHPYKLMGWKVMFPIFWNNSGPNGGDVRTVVRLLRNKNAKFFHTYYWYLLPLPLLLLFISPQIFFFGYFIPMTLTLWSLGLSTLNHDENGGKYMGILFGILTGGEHHHKWHHDNPGDTTGEGWLNNIIELIAYKPKEQVK